jgi:CheY-like chemotaxis protein
MQTMTFHALLVSTDHEVAAVLAPVLSGFGLGLRSCGHFEAIRELTEQRFDAVIVDFDDLPGALSVLQNACRTPRRGSTVTVALLRDPGTVRNAFGAGAHFILYKPISVEQAQASLRAANVLIKRERRRSLRVPLQVPAQLRIGNGPALEGILLDLSEDGADLLSSQPLCPSASIHLQFTLPGGAPIEVTGEVAWANPNGQSGVRFVGLLQSLRTSLRDWVLTHVRKFQSAESETAAPSKLTDLSNGGCYAQTESPFPERTGVVLRLKVAGVELHAQGMVRVMHPGSGMGIEFTSRSAQEREEIADFIKFLISFPGTSPELDITPGVLAAVVDPAASAAPAAEELHDPLLDLLRNHESLSQDDFLQELEKQRGLVAVTAS